ncbi:hypothetical protein BHM03_00012505 [Ensete ventricosum]|nr:hypothetical protein BHM03_00012505 [Ensete ventricosum]
MEYTNLRHRIKLLEHIEVVDRPLPSSEKPHVPRTEWTNRRLPISTPACATAISRGIPRKGAPDLETLLEETKPTRGAPKKMGRDSTACSIRSCLEAMSRVHPAPRKIDDEEVATTTNCPSVWTVWKKSSMGFRGTDGFSIYESMGRLAFRVDNYSRKRKCIAGELLLMDGNGNAVVTLGPQFKEILSSNMYK